MPDNGTAHAQPTEEELRVATPPHLQHDGRVLLNRNEQMAAASALSKIITKTWVEKHANGISSFAATDLVTAAIRAVNHERLGEPEGTICYHPETGQMARRYWSDRVQRLRWVVVDPAHDGGMDVTTVDELEAVDETPWVRAHTTEWEYATGPAE
jgi:hypothetical protein